MLLCCICWHAAPGGGGYDLSTKFAVDFAEAPSTAPATGHEVVPICSDMSCCKHCITPLSTFNIFACLLQLKSELGSSVPGLSMLLHRYAPHDTYSIWKVGDRLRVDGSLMGLDGKTPSLLPEWKRGHFSLIFDGSVAGSSPRLLFLNHLKQSYIDLGADKKDMKEGEEEVLEDDVKRALHR